ncbi:MAG: hypothetical protein U1E96_03180 [Azonexus sp.]
MWEKEEPRVLADHPGAGHRLAFVERYILRQAAHLGGEIGVRTRVIIPTASFIVILYAGLVALRPGGHFQHLDVRAEVGFGIEG